MDKKLKALLEKKKQLVADARAILDVAGENDLTDEQQAEFDALQAKITATSSHIEKYQALIAEENATAAINVETPVTEKAQAKADAPQQITVGETNHKPFASLAEQLMAIQEAGSPGGSVDPRLSNAAVSGASVGVPSDGGFLVQQDHASAILDKTYSTGQILPRVRRVPISANSNGLVVNAVDETSRATGSRLGGVQAYWAGEGEQPTSKKMKFRQINLKLKKLIGLSYMTDELLADAAAMENIVMDGFASEIAFMVEEAILNGGGAYDPAGILGANATVTVAKETGQDADTVIFSNISKMWARLWNRSRANAVWIINQDVLPELDKLSLPIGTAGTPMYQQPSGLADEPYGRLKGRPVLESEHSATLGDLNDIALIDPSQYILIDKGGAKQDVSIHVRFDYDEAAFRIVYRVDGQPIWNSALTPFKGANTVSPYINLAARA